MPQGTPCSIDGCEGRPVGRGWCRKHYQRWRNHGDPLAIMRRERAAEHCIEDGCMEPVKGRDLCGMHYERFRRSRIDGRRCSLDGCNQPAVARGICEMHNGRKRRTGDPLTLVGKGAPRQDFVGYGAAHRRAVSERGRAKTHACQHCGNQAHDWAYDHEDPDAILSDRREGNGCYYSLDPTHYIPLCKSCHRKFDFAWRSARVS